MSSSPRPFSSNRPLSRRLGMYFLGVAIGAVLVGFLLTSRQAMLGGQHPEQPAGASESP